MVDYRRQATREIVDIIRRHNRRGVFATEIPQDPRVAESPSHGLPVVAYAPTARGSRAYRQLTAELVRADRAPLALTVCVPPCANRDSCFTIGLHIPDVTR